MHAQLELENKGSVSRVQFAQRGTLLQVSDSEAAEDGEETAVASVGDRFPMNRLCTGSPLWVNVRAPTKTQLPPDRMICQPLVSLAVPI